MTKLFMMLKPDTLKRELTRDIINELKAMNCVIEEFDFVKPPLEKFYEHYADVIQRVDDPNYFYSKIKTTFEDEYVVPMIVSIPSTIEEIRQKIGSTQPLKANEGTIRKKYGLDDNYDDADQDNRMVNNLIHCSDSIENAEKELYLWFKKE